MAKPRLLESIAAPRPLYNLPAIVENNNAVVVICEGEKSADAAARLLPLPEYVTTTPMNGAASPHLTNWQPLEGRKAVIWPDNDEAGKNFTKAVKGILSYSEVMALDIATAFPDKAEKWDAADALAEGYETSQIVEIMNQCLEAKSDKYAHAREEDNAKAAYNDNREAKLPNGYTLTKHGLYYEDDFIASPIEVVALTRDSQSENWGRKVLFCDADGIAHELSIPMDMMAGDGNELYCLLSNLGLIITTARGKRARLLDYIQNARITKRITCAPRLGWHDKHFILPDCTIPENDSLFYQTDGAAFTGFQASGELSQWQEEVAQPCEGNSRLVFALSCAFAAPLLPIAKIESGGFNFRGNSSMGKSTALEVAASVWGSRDYVQQWKATGNALEAVAEGHNHALLCLDELGQVEAREAGEVSYMLANGAGKNRMKAKGALRRKYQWQLLFLSTGEISLADKLNEGGKPIRAGMLTRFADIPADAGRGFRMFDSLGKFDDGHAMAQHLKQSTARYYGTAIRNFLLNASTILDSLPDILKEIEVDFIADHVAGNADGQVKRVAARFALVAAGGELAISSGILPYNKGEAMGAVATCFQAWLTERGGSNAHEGEAAIAQVRNFIEAHHASRFIAMHTTESGVQAVNGDKVLNVAGYKRRNENGGYDYFANSGVFKNEICKGMNVQVVCNALLEKNLLIQKENGKNTSKVTIPDGSRARLYHLSPLIISEGE